MTFEQIAAHEAGHVAAAVLLDFEVSGADADTGWGGVAHVDWLTDDFDRDRGRDAMVMLIAGPIEQDFEKAVPRWPLDRGARQEDERVLAILAGHLGLDEDGYGDVVREALELTLREDYRRLHTAVCCLFELVPRFGREALEELKRIATPKEGPAWNT